MTHPPVDTVVDEMLRRLHGEPVFMAGSLAAAHAHGNPTAWSDVDIFVPNEGMLFTTITTLLCQGAVPIERFDRVWYRWRNYGLRKWHTNSMRLETSTGIEVNVVYKLVDGHPTTSLAEVLQSFDFGLAAMGWDMEDGTYRDMRSFLFPDMDIEGPLPLVPKKRGNWVQGFISQYNGLREGMRYLKYVEYGYDMSAVRDDLLTGYRMAALYHSSSFDKEKQALGELYERIAEAIEDGDTPELHALYQVIDFNDPISEILDRLE